MLERDEAYLRGVEFGLTNMGVTVCVEPDLDTQCAFVCGWVDGRSVKGEKDGGFR